MASNRIFPKSALISARFISMLAATGVLLYLQGPALGQVRDDHGSEIARSLASLVQAGKAVMGANQRHINDPSLGDKGLDGKTVLAQVLKNYQQSTKLDLNTIDPNSRHGKLTYLLMESIVEVVDANQQTMNQQGVGFKAFTAALFARLVNERFNPRANGMAEIKITAPAALLRNRKAQADEWESEVIRDKLMSARWVKGQSYTAVTQTKGRPSHRTAVPEYYSAPCLACHGSPKGEIDITGFPKEGAKEGDLAGVISVTLFH